MIVLSGPVIFEGTKEAWDCGTKQNSCKRTFFDGQVCISGWKDEAIIAPSQEFTVLSLLAMIKEPFCYKNAPKTCETVSVDCRVDLFLSLIEKKHYFFATFYRKRSLFYVFTTSPSESVTRLAWRQPSHRVKKAAIDRLT